MRYTDLPIKIDNKDVKQININQARKFWKTSTTIYMIPCNLRIDNAWQPPFSFTYCPKIDLDFEILIDEVAFYNCDSRRGQYLNFFVKL